MASFSQRRRLGWRLLVLPVVLFPATTRAATSSGSASVGATVVASCSLAATTLDFGTYVGAQIDATSTITITCTSTTGYNVGVNHGVNSGFGTSFMMGPGSAVVQYLLYRDAARTQEWSTTIGTNTVVGTGNGTAQALTVYGRAFSGTLVAPGTYSDTVTAIITY